MSLHSWFHKNNKYLMAGLVVLLMIAFGLPMTAMVPSDPRLGEINGEKVSRSDRYTPAVAVSVLQSIETPRRERPLEQDMQGTVRFLAQWAQQIDAVLRDPGEIDQARVEDLQKQLRDVNQDANILYGYLMSGEAGLFSMLHDYVFPAEGAGRYPEWWRALVLLRKADGAGVIVTDSDMAQFNSFVNVLGKYGLLNSRYTETLATAGHTQAMLDDGTIAVVKMFKFLQLRSEAVTTSTAEMWSYYYADSISRTANYVRLDSDLFLDDVVATDTQLQAFYEQHMDREMDPTGEAPGYKMPRRIKIEVATAPLGEIEASVEVSEEDARAYYDDPLNADEFVRPADTPLETDEDSESTDDPGAGAEETTDTADASATDADAEQTDGAEEPEPDDAAEDEPKKQPFEDVRETIVEKVKKARALEIARRRVDRTARGVVNRLRDRNPDFVSMTEVSREAELSDPSIVLDEQGGDFHTANELSELLPANSKTTRDALIGGDIAVGGFAYAVSAETPFVAKLLGVREAAVIPFDEVREQVVEHWRPTGALELAHARAEKLAVQANERGIEAALDSLNEELGLPEDSAIQMQTSGRISAGSGWAWSGAPTDIVEQIFDADVGKWVAVSPGRNAAFAVQPVDVGDHEAADALTREEFSDGFARMHSGFMAVKRRQVVRGWLQALLDGSSPDRAAIEEDAEKGDQPDEPADDAEDFF